MAFVLALSFHDHVKNVCVLLVQNILHHIFFYSFYPQCSILLHSVAIKVFTVVIHANLKTVFKHLRRSSIIVGDHLNVLLFMSRGGCFFVCSRYILSLFIFQFVYLCLYFYLFIVGKIRFDIRMGVYTYHKINPALLVLFDYMEKMVLLCRDSVLHVAGSRQRKWSRLGKTITFTCNTKIDFIKKQAHWDLSK